jgi:hypothetical protein
VSSLAPAPGREGKREEEGPAYSLSPDPGGEGWGEGAARRAHAAFPINPRGLNASATTMITKVKTTL